ncbi:protein neprosin-like [Coffea arabica]|uniref:Protein neprosin-like n=1 Tax=Coffea arabica TaxID=13443 RepID=A0A6P6W366_COFAR
MESKAIHCFLILLIISSICDASRLSQLNKTPLKSIESKDGDVIDCVHIYHQPAFDHPLLKDHVIQMRPKHQPEGLLAENRQLNRRKSITQLWQSSGSCPEETIPIRRTKQVDASGASFIPSINLHNKGANTELIGQAPTLQFVAALVGDDQYHGATANINVWEPQVQQSSDFSSSQLSFTAGSDVSNFDSIQAGWHVHPLLYGDSSTRLFIAYFTIHNSQTIGCFNLLCSGFVQTSNEIALGAAISPLSTFHGAQFGVDVLIFKDPSQDVWWLHYEGTPIGYWPSKLFADLANTASVITWGGSVLSSESDGQQTTTQMGSGHFPEEGFGGASYMRDLYLVDESLKLKPLGNPTTSAKQPNCYNITLGRNEGGGDFIFYGGPGRNPNCP